MEGFESVGRERGGGREGWNCGSSMEVANGRCMERAVRGIVARGSEGDGDCGARWRPKSRGGAGEEIAGRWQAGAGDRSILFWRVEDRGAGVFVRAADADHR